MTVVITPILLLLSAPVHAYMSSCSTLAGNAPDGNFLLPDSKVNFMQRKVNFA